jgi:hypothetical protein
MGSAGRYRQGIGNVTPADVYFARRQGIIQPKKQKQVTLDRRFHYNLGQVARHPQGELVSEL